MFVVYLVYNFMKHLSIYLCLYSPFLDLGRFFSFCIFYTVGRNPWMEDQPVVRPLPVHRAAETQNKRTQTSMSRMGFDLTIPVFERAKTVHTLDGTATLIGLHKTSFLKQQIVSYRLSYSSLLSSLFPPTLLPMGNCA
jgi:hypothetical protein